MGARQSKRSVDITTDKEVIEGGEVAASGGEGKLERIEDLDTLKPQLNGDTAHQDVEISEKEKKMQQQDEAPENEKDTCNEKDIILSPVTNGTHDDGETPKETAETIEAETNKKNKKEKVKKKWSFRSFSFNKKDKQKPTKKEETNGECEKVPEEAAENSAPVSNETESKMETEATEKEALKMDEKTPETPVTEPMTNGSSAPESPKEEVRQNGESAPVDEPAVVAEPAPPAPEAAKPAEVQPPAPEVPSVESLPINGLKIDDSPAEEVKVESKVDAPPAPAEVTPAPEVCVAKEKPEVAESAEVAPPPLPANPPPSSLTIFAETTMAPHLVDKPVAGELPVVDVDASLSSIPPPIPVNTATDDAQQANSETTVCEIKPVDNVPSASSNDIVQNQSPPTSDEKIFETPIIANNTINTPLESVPLVNETNEIVDSCVKSEIVENLAVVSTTNVPDIPAPSSETEPISPVSQITENKTALLEESVVDNKPIQETVDVVPVAESAPVSEPIEQTATENNHVQEIIEKDTITPIESNPNVEVNPANANEIESIVSNIVESEPVSLGNIPVSTEIKNELETNVTTLPLEEVQSIISLESESNVNVLPPVINESIPPLNAPDSPLLQRTPSDPDMSESDLKEPQSDSFPPPPPPASCPESITEISVSESLPPPPSESSQPDTVLNSPTSEIADFPPKDLPSPVKNDQNTEQKDSVETEALPVVEPQVVQTTLHENSIAPTTETATTNGINGLPESPVELSNGEESQQPPPADTSLQVKSVNDVVADIQIPDSAPIISTEVAAVEVSASAE